MKIVREGNWFETAIMSPQGWNAASEANLAPSSKLAEYEAAFDRTYWVIMQ